MKYRKIAMRAAVIIVVFIMVLIVGFFMIRQQGKRNIEGDITAETAGYAMSDGTENMSEEADTQLTEKEYEVLMYEGQEYHYRDNLVNILCLGIDKDEIMSVRDNTGNSVGQSDAIYVASLDFDAKKVRIIAVPRDTMVTLEMYDGDGYYMGSCPGQLSLIHI